MLTLKSYRDSGGVAAAIAKRADATFDSFAPEQQAIARRAMLRLTQPGQGTEDTRRRAPLSELPTSPEEIDSVARVIDELVDARLLTTSVDESSGEQWVDVSHEALIRAWPRLRQWLDEDRAGLLVHRRVTESAAEWRRLRKDEGTLYRGARLGEAIEWQKLNDAALNPAEREFLAASAGLAERERDQAEQRRERELQDAKRIANEQRRSAKLLRLVAAVVVLGLVIATVLGGLAWIERDSALRQRRVAEDRGRIALARELAAVSASKLATDPQLALLLALEAAKRSRTSEVRDALEHAVLVSYLRGNLPAGSRPSATYSSDGRRILICSVEGLSVWDSSTRARLAVIRAPRPADLQPVYSGFSADGRYVIAVPLSDPRERVWNAANGTEANGVSPRLQWTANGLISPRGDRFLWFNSNDSALSLRAPSGRVIANLGRREVSGAGSFVSWSPDGSLVAAAFGSGIVVYDGENGRVVMTLQGAHANRGPGFTLPAPGVNSGSYVDTTAFSPDGQRLVASGNKSWIWDTRTWSLVGTGSGGSLAFDVGSRVVAVASGGPAPGSGAPGRTYGVAVYSLADGRRLASVEGDRSQPLTLAISPDDRFLAAGESDGQVRVWDAKTGAPISAFSAETQATWSLAFSPADPRLLLTGGSDPVIRMWDVSVGAPVTHLGPPGPLGALGPQALDRVTTGPRGDTALATRGNVAEVTSLSSGSVTVLRGHTGRVIVAGFSLDGRLVITGSEDGTARVWNPATGDTVSVIHVGDPVVNVSLSAVGVALTVDVNGRSRAWDAKTGLPLADLGRVDRAIPPEFVAGDGWWRWCDHSREMQ